MVWALVLGLLASIAIFVLARPIEARGEDFPFHDPDLSVEERVDDLVARLTLAEKVAQMVFDAPAIPRLGVPAYNWWNECLHGVARAGKATVFPQAIGLAATWDVSHHHRVAQAIGDEARAKHHHFLRQGKREIYQGLTFWSPNINLFRDPRWGRGQETYGEDPFLTGELGAVFVRGLQGNHPRYLKLVATPKHFAVHSGPEPDRHTFDAQVDDRDLQMNYLPHFKKCVIDAGAWSVMCAYNRFRGEPCCGSNPLLQKILRDQWGFRGYVVSDCGAIKDFWAHHRVVDTPAKAAAKAVRAGTDLNCGDQYPNLVAAVEMGLISEAEIDRSVKRLFAARFRLGMFDPEERVPFAGIPYSVVDSPEHDLLALETARKSMVLLKNDGQLLPLSKNLKSVAVIGPNANNVDVLLGNYNGTPTHPVTVLAGIRRAVGHSMRVRYAQGCELAQGLRTLEIVPAKLLTTPAGQSGVVGEYFANVDLTGQSAMSRVDSTIDFYWADESPFAEPATDIYSVRWDAVLTPAESGSYDLGVTAVGRCRLQADDRLVAELDFPDHTLTKVSTIELVAGQPLRLRLEYSKTRGEGMVQLVWAAHDRDLQSEALSLARSADAVILCLGLSPRLEGEEMPVAIDGFSGGDRLTLDLPDVQQQLMQAIAQLGKPTVLVLMNGSPLSIEWADRHIPAILEAWYPGQRGGDAVADVLFGDYNPGGRLPITFYRSVDQLPPFSDYSMAQRTYRFFSGSVLYPFGHGLSYTHFTYHDLVLSAAEIHAGERLRISATVRNIGDRAGEEVVQLYITDLQASVPVPIRSLAGFQRVFLPAGESRRVDFVIEPQAFAMVDDRGIWRIEAGEFDLFVGGQQPGFAKEGAAAALSARLIVSGDLELSH